MIDGVMIKKLKVIPDNRGRLMEIFRSDDGAFRKFGQVYMTTVYRGIIKAWHYHKIQTDNFACVRGEITLGLYDARENSPTYGATERIVMSLENPVLVSIPPLVYHGFKGEREDESVVINTPTEPYNHAKPDEYRVDPHDKNIPFDWGK
ncbi:MAG: dTDP-4-dehydrorhamnose 3,5-epimerase family protein [Candidatus Omnitrophota bacterium]